MATSRKVSPLLIVLAVFVGVSTLRQLTFVPPPADRHVRLAAPLISAAGAAAMFASVPAAHADSIGDAAKNLADVSYPLIQKIDWAKTPVITKWLDKSQGFNPRLIAEAVDSTLKLGVKMDPALIKASVAAHDTAVLNAQNVPGLVTPLADHEAVTESIARMLASAPAADIRAVFDTYYKVGLEQLNGAWFAELQGDYLREGRTTGDVGASYKAFLALKDAVKAAAPKEAADVAAAPSVYSDKLGSAAKDLADAVYPLFEKIQWEKTPVLTKWFQNSVPTWDAAKFAAAVDSVLKLSVAMDSKLITQAVAVHDKAIMDAIGKPGLVTPSEDNEAVFESIARMFASAPDKVKPVFDTFAELGIKDLNTEWFDTLPASQAQAAFEKFQVLADAVKAR